MAWRRSVSASIRAPMNTVRRIFGARNYLVLDHLRRLPEKLPTLYVRLTH
jgi:hypothetical protein